MPGTPSPLKLGFQRNSYIHVSCENDHQNSTPEVEQTMQLITDPDPLTNKDCEQPLPPVASGVSHINEGEDDQMEVFGYCKSVPKTIFTWICIVTTAGILRLIFHWYPRWFLQATHTRCHLSVADKVLLIEQYQKKHRCYFVKTVSTITAQDLFNSDSVTWDEQTSAHLDGDGISVKGRLSIHLSGGHFKEYDNLRIFHCKKLCYVWDDEREEFMKLQGLDKEVTTANLHKNQGLSKYSQQLRRAVYGRNEIVVPVRTVVTLLFLEVLNPFYIFQLFSFTLWFIDDYVYYAVAIMLMSSFGITMSIIQTRKNQHKLRSTVHSSDVVTVVRSPSEKMDVIPTEQLVPGDMLLVPPHGCIMHCDAVLLAGNCIVNESMLTGESVPVTKTPLPCTQDLYEAREHAKHTLFCGTHIIQTRYYGSDRVLAVVIRTGFSTAKGALVRSIMYPPPVDFKFERDSYKFVMLLAAVASVGFLYTTVSKYLRGIGFRTILLKSLDLITIAVPPALPAAMTVGRYYAQRRLEEKEIYCISPRTINVSGSIDCVCFDKTGTLTEDGMDMWGVIPISKQKFEVPVKVVSTMKVDKLLIGLATCHSLTVIDNKISGDPLDLKMFEYTNWALEEPEVNDNTKFDIMSPTVVRPRHTNKAAGLSEELEIEVGILHQFPFSSSLQRMSVITRCLGTSQLEAYCKGSPEMIVSLSLPETVPADFCSVLEEYTQEGYRVIAIASKELRKVSYAKVQRLTREEVESKLTFLGLIVMENRLKPETTGIIEMLSQANIRTIMVTGDNILTSLSVARDCGIIPVGQNVIIVQALASQPGMNAQLAYTHSSYNVGPHTSMVNDVGSRDINNSSSVTSFEPFACPTPDSSQFDKPNMDSFTFALTGHTWSIIRAHFPDVIPRIVTRGAVFARMNPEQKQQLVQELQVLGYYVAMCGDGANDCGALKAAHTGISLSEAESSVASPFTSKQANISCVPHVIREGRAALVTSFGTFKYMAAYSLTQFISVMILYSIDTNLGDLQYLYVDLFLITVFAFFFGRTQAYSGPLVKSPPILSLVSPAPILSVVSQVALVALMQVLAFILIQQTEWFVPFKPNDSHEIEGSYENYAIFTVSSLQYIVLALVFSKGAPYRKSLFTNYGFLISLVVMTAFTLYIILDPFDSLRDMLVLMLPPTMSFRLVLIGIAFSNLVIAFIIEYFVIDYILMKKTNPKCRNKDESSCKYMSVERELSEDPSWPPITTKPLIESLKSDDKPPRSPVEISEIGIEFHRNGFI